jgi:hypothetical protein
MHRAPTPFSFLTKPVGTAPRNSGYQPTSLLPLPPRSSELNSQENIWQFMASELAVMFKSFDDIVDHCCYALEHTYRPTVEDHVHRPTRLGDRRLLILRIGITSALRAGERDHADVCCSA